MLMHYLTIMRTVWLAGRPGGGKTSLAIAMALQLVNSGHCDKVCCNTPLRIGTQVAEIEVKDAQQLRDVCTILDEAWMELGKGAGDKQQRGWLAYRRKWNQYLILPSVLELSPTVASFTVERYFNGMPFGLNVWWYKFLLRSSEIRAGKGKRKPDVGNYLWWNPKRVFPLYDHLAEAGDTYYVYQF